MPQSETIETAVTPEKLIYSNADFRIYACITKDPSIQLNSYQNCTVKGVMPRLELGVEYRADLELDKVDPKYGASYKCISIYQDIPESREGQREYLATLMTPMAIGCRI